VTSKNVAALGMVLISVLASGLLMAQVSLEDRIRDRVSPAGSVCLAGQPCAAGVTAASTAATDTGAARDPQQIYQSSCFACHGTGASDAPVLGDVDAWAPRIAQGMDVLYASTINGLNIVMPARGLCIDCSDDDLRAVTDYIVENSQ